MQCPNLFQCPLICWHLALKGTFVFSAIRLYCIDTHPLRLCGRAHFGFSCWYLPVGKWTTFCLQYFIISEGCNTATPVGPDILLHSLLDLPPGSDITPCPTPQPHPPPTIRLTKRTIWSPATPCLPSWEMPHSAHLDQALALASRHPCWVFERGERYLMEGLGWRGLIPTSWTSGSQGRSERLMLWADS